MGDLDPIEGAAMYIGYPIGLLILICILVPLFVVGIVVQLFMAVINWMDI